MRSAKGTILVTTLWILTLLTLLAIGIGVRLGVDIKLIGFALNSARAHYLAEAGLRKAIVLLEQDDNQSYDALNETWSTGLEDPDDKQYLLRKVALGDGTFTVSHEIKDSLGNTISLYGASDEEGKININRVDGDTLAKLGLSDDLVAAIIDWRDVDGQVTPYEAGRGAEQPDYDELEVPYECKNADFSVPEELLLVIGMRKDIYDGVKDIITVHGEDKSVNMNTASEAVITALTSGIYEELPAKIITYRNGGDGEPGTSDDNVFKSPESVLTPLAPDEQDFLRKGLIKDQMIGINSSTFKIISRGEVRDGRVKKTIEAVIRRGREDSPVLSYYEN